MKKIICLALSLVMLFGLFAVPSAADNDEPENYNEAIIQAVENLESVVYLSNYNVTYQDVLNTINLINYNMPELNFYLDLSNCHVEYYINYATSQKIVTKLFLGYDYNKTQVAKMKKEIEEVGEYVLGQIDQSWSDTEKALFIHDWLCANFMYDNRLFTDNGSENHNIYGFFSEGVGVCESYTNAYTYLLRLCGMKSYMAISDEDNHAWNVVKINGNWYHVDVTHDDPIVDEYAVLDYLGNVSHEFFLLSNEEIDNGNHDNWYIPFDIDETIVCKEYNGNECFREAVSAVVPIGEYWYYIDYDRYNGGLVRTKNFNKSELIYKLNGLWAIDETGRGYPMYFSALYKYNNNLLFNSNDSLYVYDPETDTTTRIIELTEEGKENGRFYGMNVDTETGQCLFLVSDLAGSSYQLVYSCKTCDFGHNMERWELVEDATEFKDGLKVYRCDVCGEILDEEILPSLGNAICGDCDGDGEVAVNDLAVIKLFLVDSQNHPVNQGADFNKDNSVDSVDLALIKIYLAGA